MKKNFIMGSMVLLCLIILYSNDIYAQNITDSTHIGLCASFQGPHSDILIPIRTSNLHILAPVFGISSIKDAGTEIELALMARFYFSRNIVAPFVAGRVGTIIYSPTHGDAIGDFICGISGGAEYYFNRNFSIGIECQFNLGIAAEHSVRFGSPGGYEFSSSTALFATIYF